MRPKGTAALFFDDEAHVEFLSMRKVVFYCREGGETIVQESSAAPGQLNPFHLLKKNKIITVVNKNVLVIYL